VLADAPEVRIRAVQTRAVTWPHADERTCYAAEMSEVTKDGCPIGVYTLLQAAGEPEIIHAALPAGASVLDLGSAGCCWPVI
jgi:hypothetical protein